MNSYNAMGRILGRFTGNLYETNRNKFTEILSHLHADCSRYPNGMIHRAKTSTPFNEDNTKAFVKSSIGWARGEEVYTDNLACKMMTWEAAIEFNRTGVDGPLVKEYLEMQQRAVALHESAKSVYDLQLRASRAALTAAMLENEMSQIPSKRHKR
jgi:hypothetical protein